MKKVLLSAYACLPNHGSEEGNGWNYATLLGQQGFIIHCLTKQQGRAAIEPVLATNAFPNVNIHYVPIPNWVERFAHKGLIGMYFHYLYWQWQAYRLGKQLDQAIGFDLVHHVTYGSIQLGSFLYKLRKPFVMGPVGGGQQAPKAFKRYFGAYWSREWMREWVGTLLQYVNPAFFGAVRQADRLIVTNRDTYRLATRLRPNRPTHRIFDAGLVASFMPPRPIERKPGKTLKLLWVGRLMPRKALELTIEAFSRVNPDLPISLTIVGGKGEMAEQVPHYLDRYGVRDRVNWVGHVSYDEVKVHYERSDVFLFTSLRDSCPHQVLEAMAYSLPVVTLDLHGQGELVDASTGFRVAVTEPEQVVTELARAIEWLYDHPAERLRMGRAAHAFSQTVSWEDKVRLIVENVYACLPGFPVADKLALFNAQQREPVA